MDRYVASLARACLEMGGLETFYTDNIPSDFAVPSLYFPPEEIDPSGSALNSYRTDYTIYAKVFAATRQDAMDIAESIVEEMMRLRRLLPVYNPDGTESGELIKVDPPAARVIDEGVAQINLAYHIVRKYKEQQVTMVQNIGINKYYD